MDEDAIAALEQAMAKAAADCDFEAAGALRDRIHTLRNGGMPISADLAGIKRQQPGAMGLGTSQQRAEPPPGWSPPKKPDPMTRGTSKRRR
jgi:hypothetical protein